MCSSCFTGDYSLPVGRRETGPQYTADGLYLLPRYRHQHSFSLSAQYGRSNHLTELDANDCPEFLTLARFGHFCFDVVQAHISKEHKTSAASQENVARRFYVFHYTVSTLS